MKTKVIIVSHFKEVPPRQLVFYELNQRAVEYIQSMIHVFPCVCLFNVNFVLETTLKSKRALMLNSCNCNNKFVMNIADKIQQLITILLYN